MMEFNEGQVDLFKALSFKDYIDEVFSHCEVMYPALVSSQHREKFCYYIEQSIALAKKADFTQRGPVRLFIDMIILLGYNFEQDPQYQWAKFNEMNKASSQLEKSMMMYRILEQYIAAVYGENNVFFEQSLVKLSNLNINTISDSKENYHNNTHELLNYIHPQRYDLLGHESIDNLISFSDENIQSDRIIKPNHKSYLVLIRFLLGGYFYNDFFRYDLSLSKLASWFSEENAGCHNVVLSSYSSLRFNNH